MSELIYISRNFTELGGFKSDEIIDFHKRSILTEKDFVRVGGEETWLPLHDWISGARDASPIKTAAGGTNGHTTTAQSAPTTTVKAPKAKKAKRGS
ncbi:hypothetical protein [Verrucomicrobium sp. BvORR106]|uniref:hypothetical protein n=1 Tax=Verrucomicrobium sp. BvORR106 TaxID=1403819 RepID=UPI00056EDDB2|nr:hypothetical protein [Verrucomicrobium sp. BvORR106]